MSLYYNSIHKYTSIQDNPTTEDPVRDERSSGRTVDDAGRRSLNASENDVSKKSYYQQINYFFKKHISDICIFVFLIIAFILGLILLYIIIILITLIIVGFNEAFEYTMVAIIGRNLYNKNFPVCTDTDYISYNCYKTTSTYCNT